MIKSYLVALSLFITGMCFAQTSTSTQTAKKPATVKAKTTKTIKYKPKKSLAKTTKPASVSGASAPASTKATTSPTTPSTGTRTAINQSPAPANNTPSQPTTTGSSRDRSTTTTNTTTTNTPTNTNTNTNTNASITELDAASALRDALSSGISDAVTKTSALNGFLGNPDIKIPFPQSASTVETALTDLGLQSMVDNVVTSLNRAAENAAVQATPIFLGSIKQLTFTDALNIVDNSQPDAATQFLQRTTTEQLVAAFKPSIKTALDNANATKYWTALMTEYNKIPFVQPIETDLPDYVTRKAISGLFVMVAKEEANIRKNPFGQTSPMIKKVFGRTITR